MHQVEYYDISDQLGMDRDSLKKVLQLNCAGKPDQCRGNDCNGFCLADDDHQPKYRS